MVHLKVLSGPLVGQSLEIPRYPCRVGKAVSADLVLEAPGLWDEHFEIQRSEELGFTIRSLPNSLTTVNGLLDRETRLRNGDVIEAGGLKLQFWLTASRQKSLSARERATWAAFLLLSLGQIAIVYALSR